MHYYFGSAFSQKPLVKQILARISFLCERWQSVTKTHLEGCFVRGPSFPKRCRILTANEVCSQSSINSHRCARPVSFASGLSSIMVIIVSAMDALYSKPPSSRNMADRKFISTLCFRGNFNANARIAWTTTTLNSSLISDTKLAICFIKRSTEDSAPVETNK